MTGREMRSRLFGSLVAAVAAVGLFAEGASADVTVNTTVDEDVSNAACSLREAIFAVNNDISHNGCARGAATGSCGGASCDAISFALGTGTPSISVGSALPAFTGPVIVDGATGGATRMEITVNPGLSIQTGLQFSGNAASNSVVKNLVINSFTGRQLQVVFNASGIVMEGNLIGLDPTGTSLKGSGNPEGVELSGSGGHRIGGTTPAQRNVIAVPGAAIFQSGGSNTVIQGNFIKTNATGSAALGGADSTGIFISNANAVVIGGDAAGAGNVITGRIGISVTGNPALPPPTGTVIQGNFIGTDVSGTVDLGGSLAGIAVPYGLNTTIGGTTPGAGNLISGYGTGIDEGAPSNGTGGNNTVIQNNRIGTDVSGTGPLGNSGFGIFLFVGPNHVVEGNVIAFNGGDGIEIRCSACVARLSQNSIHSNGGIGIDLRGTDGVTTNDAADPDTGPNGLENFPVLDTPEFPGGTSVSGTLNSTPGRQFRIDG